MCSYKKRNLQECFDQTPKNKQEQEKPSGQLKFLRSDAEAAGGRERRPMLSVLS